MSNNDKKIVTMFAIFLLVLGAVVWFMRNGDEPAAEPDPAAPIQQADSDEAGSVQ